jgi:hypothetical protein
MTIDDLKISIPAIAWFSRLGEPDYEGRPDYFSPPNMDDWKNVTGVLANEAVPRIIEAGMEWLPTQRDQEDPIHGSSLEQRAEVLGKRDEFSKQALEIYKATLASLRTIKGHPALKIGAHDFTEAARGAALYAVRRTAYETLLGEPNFWCKVMKVYQSGHWPCGLLPDRKVVVL